jgi:hypothetical protein
LEGVGLYLHKQFPMKNIWFALILSVMFMGCKHEIKPADIAKINGYWEIEKVILPDGESKDYAINETIDFFSIHDNAGFRKKITPELNGKYLEYGNQEKVEVVFEDDKAFLSYATKMMKWKEEIMEVTDQSLVLKNASNIEYHYKKPVPFSVK